MYTHSRPVVKSVARKFSRWIRFYEDSLHDPKIVTLSDRQFRDWCRLMLIASRHPLGHLPALRDIASDIRCTVADASAALEDLFEIGLIDIVQQVPETVYAPHNWTKRQFVSDCEGSAKRVRKHRSQKGSKQGCNGDVTLQKRSGDDDVTPTKRPSNEISSESVSASVELEARYLPIHDRDGDSSKLGDGVVARGDA
jgi:hypothetical protein